jgi:hypothetical protein
MERRRFLRSLAFSGTIMTTAGVLTACKSSTAATDGEFSEDEPIVRAGAEFEAMGVKTYETAANSGLMTEEAVINTAVAFMNDHIKHLDELNKLLKTNDFAIVNLEGASPDPGVGSVSNQTDIVKLALNVEFQAATFYFSNIVTAIKSSAALRVFANILPVETAHFINYKNILGYTPAIDGAIFEEITSGL